MRVAFFNELDTFCIEHGLDTRDVIMGTSLDPRIGNFYNNPSFGYGGYCLPKDTKQLLANFADTPNELMSAIVKSNSTRKDYIVKDILKAKPKTVGVYRLAMKAGSDNFRMSSILDIMEKLRESGIEVIIFEPNISESTYLDFRIVNFDELAASSDLVIANRQDEEILSSSVKVYTRDIFSNN
jgi:UDPglucose 6-dehydrogenase